MPRASDGFSQRDRRSTGAIGAESSGWFRSVVSGTSGISVRNVYAVDRSFPFRPPADWPARAAELRAKILACAGLRPMPARPPVKAHVARVLKRADYRVENVWLEVGRGLVLGGNLYIPEGRGPFPAVLHPHGHWDQGRMSEDEDGSSQAFCISLARGGYLAFAWDMIGYHDTRQLPHDFHDRRLARWGITLLGLQLWNSLRALDWIAARPDVGRIGVAGASGGATQSMLLGAVDDRVAAAALCCMISASMQGGCLCENAPGLRVGTSNVEMTAAFAPRPLLLVSATGDWTSETPRVEYPAIREVYRRLGAEANVENAHFDLPHNLLRESREAVYDFFERHLGGARIRERAYVAEKESDLRSHAPQRAVRRVLLAEARARSREDLEGLCLAAGIRPPQVPAPADGPVVTVRLPKIRDDRRRRYARLSAGFWKRLAKWVTGRGGPRVRIALDEYFDCYNRTEDAERLQRLFEEIDRLHSKGNRVQVELRKGRSDLPCGDLFLTFRIIAALSSARRGEPR